MRDLDRLIPKLVIAPSFAAALLFVYGFIGWTVYISFTKSGILPRYELDGVGQYARLFANPRWDVAVSNLFVFGGLFIALCLVIGILLAILIDQKIRAEGVLRTIYLYPMAVSFIVTGTAWKWILNPGLGLDKVMHGLGWEGFSFDWLINPERAIYTVVIAGVWQSSGFVMALFLAGLRSFDQEVIKAATIDGAGMPTVYFRIILPSLHAVFLSAVVVLAHLAVKSFDLVVALTGGGPGYATDMPATFMYAMAFQRSQLGTAAASAVMMLMTVMAIIVPYLYSELRERRS
ncbi:carbohydrate ABC transporter permease [Rhodospirillum rubrum]|uniref:Binding-protein-dependent transport systems inner membrane component n=1 Tax=Rhodospirillum rubrum (strain ATCC 11170 / ATH 1.1.1 / DSM 467 / LMG 4362 / NCIMB 8255 / S1) TaxID=269796 RepID=Q2RY97_RHORT|nr:sugar ABC transporter permease [Rhodospirillum rubrum]ABC20898.1 Binding-protein-dependent transport systems inner membrane component [Rhodospirillum rubrum ATCC 11170]AEO46565.1 binding-protein dependent transport system inner membrane protein [Rhodospirillum rubrum F11]MBK5952456.1 sugar ABC transporter permease [Rhodospirillum rubrum]QXG80598.1 sugar ABC transporter permease [Rhodospirillum rubrum]HAP99962.1 sugar ABC transporter permease [Rhodospirillum rubrum]